MKSCDGWPLNHSKTWYFPSCLFLSLHPGITKGPSHNLLFSYNTCHEGRKIVTQGKSMKEWTQAGQQNRTCEQPRVHFFPSPDRLQVAVDEHRASTQNLPTCLTVASICLYNYGQLNAGGLLERGASVVRNPFEATHPAKDFFLCQTNWQYENAQSFLHNSLCSILLSLVFKAFFKTIVNEWYIYTQYTVLKWDWDFLQCKVIMPATPKLLEVNAGCRAQCKMAL